MNRYLYRSIYNKIKSRALRVVAIKIYGALKQPYYRISVDTNNLCNLKCVMCSLSLPGGKSSSQIMSLTQFESLEKEVFPKTRILDLSCGFEPFMTKNFIDYIRVARKFCQGHIAICTNGLLIKESTIDRILNENLLDEITISIDGLSPETYNSIRINGNFRDLLQVLEALKEAKTKIKSNRKLFLRLNYTLMRRNIEELIGIHDFASKYSIDCLQLRHMRLTSEFTHLFSESLYFHQELSDRILKIVCKDKRPGSKITIMTPPLFSDTKGVLTTKNSCVYPWFNFSIFSDGSVKLCNFGKIGNFIDSGFKSIEASARLKEIRQGLLQGKYKKYCHDCHRITDVMDVHDVSSFIQGDLGLRYD